MVGELVVGLLEQREDILVSEAMEICLAEERAGGLANASVAVGAGDFGEAGGNEGAAAVPGLDVALGLELVVGLLDGEGGDDELLAQLPVGGETVAGGEPAAGDGVADLPHDLAVDRELAAGVEAEVH